MGRGEARYSTEERTQRRHRMVEDPPYGGQCLFFRHAFADVLAVQCREGFGDV
jgi:hypothetical protein